jgi:glycerophosphoryl diester phosphodiesterase
LNIAETHSPASRLLASTRPLVIGHRGYCQFAPENTLPSFEMAMAAGADLIELDCRPSKDGVLIVIHDPELNRTTDARRRWRKRHNKVESRTALEIQSLDAGSWFDQQFAGTRVPLLAEALECIQKSSVTLVESKGGHAVDLIHLLRTRHLINKVVVQSFDWAFLRRVHALAPEQVLGALGPPKILCSGRKPTGFLRRFSGLWLGEVQKTGAKIAVWNRQVSQKAIELAHQRGLKVWVYTINTPRRAHRLLNIGVDGLITDNPSLIWRTIALRSQREPNIWGRSVATTALQEK